MKELIFALIIANMTVYGLLAFESGISSDSCQEYRREAMAWHKSGNTGYLPEQMAKKVLGCLEYE